VFKQINFIPAEHDRNSAFFGGNPYIPPNIGWPKDSKGTPMLHLATFPASFFSEYAPHIFIDCGLVVSIFTPYDKISFEYIESAMNEGGKVIAYQPSDTDRNEYDSPPLPRLSIKVTENPDTDSSQNGTSKINGLPCWIQDEELGGLNYVLQIDEIDLDNAVPTHKAILVGGLGYLLLKERIPMKDMEAGQFVIQTS
jgi:hypothetical protein